MILYHPATDFYHCWMRFASLLCDNFGRALEYDRARIMDFYLCFPHEITNCSLPSEFSTEVRRQAKALPRGYEDRLSVRQAFQQMGSIQRQVVMDMVAKGVLRRALLSRRSASAVGRYDETRIAHCSCGRTRTSAQDLARVADEITWNYST